VSQQALWSGRFQGKVSDSTLAFTSSLEVDARLGTYDVLGSLAHVTMLGEQGILPEEDVGAITDGLRTILTSMEKGAFELDQALEDIHTNVEFQLTAAVGEAGKRLHTARSRNDQVATDLRMWLRDVVLETVSLIDSFQETLITRAEKMTEMVMPGFTHLQHAQPVSFGFHLMAHCFRLQRDAERFLDSYGRMNLSPLGAAALAGTTYPIDRHRTAELLAFAGPTENAMDSVSDRDFAIEALSCATMTALHLSSMCEELVMWSSPEFGFVEMDDAYTTGSSIMPQKKNPDIAELIRGRSGSVVGELVAMLTMMKGLPMAYNRDMQEDKAPVMRAMDTVMLALDILAKVVSTMVVKEARLCEAVDEGFINATDLADHLVVRGMPFRQAHEVVGAVVRKAIEDGKRIEDLSLDELKTFSDLIDAEVLDVLPVERCMERRSSYGGTSPKAVELQILEAICQIRRRHEAVQKEKNRIEAAYAALAGR
jgi:argininosuccinate lyase